VARWSSGRLLYLGEINDSQFEAWYHLIEAFDEGSQRHRQLALFPADREVSSKGRRFTACRCGSTQWNCIGRGNGARAGLAYQLYEQLGLDRFWSARLRDSRQGKQWRHILQTLVCYRLIDPGSEWRLHRLWFEQRRDGGSAGAPIMRWVEKNALYRCLDKLLEHKTALFDHLRQRWQDLFGASFRSAAL